MEMEYDRYDCLRYELFETLIPAMLYKGTEKERDEFFGFARSANSELTILIRKHIAEFEKMHGRIKH